MIAARVDIDVFLEAIPTVLADVVCAIKMFNFTVNFSKVFFKNLSNIKIIIINDFG